MYAHMQDKLPGEQITQGMLLPHRHPEEQQTTSSSTPTSGCFLLSELKQQGPGAEQCIPSPQTPAVSTNYLYYLYFFMYLCSFFVSPPLKRNNKSPLISLEVTLGSVQHLALSPLINSLSRVRQPRLIKCKLQGFQTISLLRSLRLAAGKSSRCFWRQIHN